MSTESTHIGFLVALVEVVIACAGFVAAAAAYFLLAPWHKSLIGRNFMFLLAILALTLTLTLVLQAVRASLETKIVLADVVYGLWAFGGVSFATAIIREQVRHRRHPDDAGDTGE